MEPTEARGGGQQCQGSRSTVWDGGFRELGVLGMFGIHGFGVFWGHELRSLGLTRRTTSSFGLL